MDHLHEKRMEKEMRKGGEEDEGNMKCTIVVLCISVSMKRC